MSHTQTAQATAVLHDRPRALLSTYAAAEHLGVTEQCLRRWRSHGIGPAYVRVGRLRKYAVRDLEDWLDSQRVGVHQAE